MKTFDDLKETMEDNDPRDQYDILKEFFSPDNEKEYFFPKEMDKKQREAVHLLFCKNGELMDRVYDALDLDFYCREAHLIRVCLLPDDDLYRNLKSYLSKEELYQGLQGYQKEEWISSLDLYRDYLIDIHNLSFALAYTGKICEIKGTMEKEDVDHYSFLYFMLERGEEFYELYSKGVFSDPVPYLMLILTLLKNAKDEEAQDVFLDLLHRYPYADYIDHLADMPEGNEEYDRFYESLNFVLEMIMSVPDFISWCHDHKEGYLLA